MSITPIVVFLVTFAITLAAIFISYDYQKTQTEVEKKKERKMFLGFTFIFSLIVAVWSGYTEISHNQNKEKMYAIAAEMNISNSVTDEINLNYLREQKSRNDFKYGEHNLQPTYFLSDKSEQEIRNVFQSYLNAKNAKKAANERVELLEMALKVHNKAVANAEGKLSGDLSCYTINFINEKTEQAEQLGTVIDLDCGAALINKGFKSIEDELSEAKSNLSARDNINFTQGFRLLMNK